MEVVDFWKDKGKAAKAGQKAAFLKEEISSVNSLRKNLADLEELSQLEQFDERLADELKKKIEKEEFRIFLSGQYDRNNAILEIFAGAGGQDSQDWVTILQRMYLRYCEGKGLEFNVLSQSFGQGGGPEGRIGTKSVTAEVRGDFAYGFLKKENGVHRLVRISPFSAQKLRHTSFALVQVLPEIDEKNSEIMVRPEDLKIDTFRASGPGGQYVNKTESAVRITHRPTGIVSSSQTERLQGKNRANAMKILLAKLHQLKEEKRAKEIKEIKGDAVSASFSNQIRSYVLHPYKLVKDLRTQYETSNVKGVLNGDLEGFIEAEIRLND